MTDNMTAEQLELKRKADDCQAEIHLIVNRLNELSEEQHRLRKQCDHDCKDNKYVYPSDSLETGYYRCEICGAEYTTPKVVYLLAICKRCALENGGKTKRTEWRLGQCGHCGGSDVPIDLPKNFGLSDRVVRGKVVKLVEPQGINQQETALKTALKKRAEWFVTTIESAHKNAANSKLVFGKENDK